MDRIYRKKQNKSKSVINTIYGLTVLISVILVINIVMGLITIFDVRSHNCEVIDNTLGEYYATERDRLNAAKHFLEWTAVNDTLIVDLAAHEADALAVQDLTKLRSRINEMKYSFGDGFMFFLSLEKGERFYAISQVKSSYDDYVEIKEHLIKEDISDQRDLIWKVFTPTNGHSPYLYYGFVYKDMYIATVISTDYLHGTLDTISLGKRGYYSFIDTEGSPIITQYGTGGSQFDIFYQHFILENEREGLPYTIDVYADVSTAIVEQQLRQLVILMVFLIIISITINYLRKIYKEVLQPIEQFQYALENAEDEESITTLATTSIKELEAASNQLKLLVHQIKDMRINIYEDELEKRRFQIAFLQNQIKPHFYLNCLSTIDSMIQLGETTQARELILFTSKYIRYMFQAGRDYVRLEYELSHIDAYLAIQNLRMDHSFEYISDVDSETLSAQIPPMLLITFVENCVKHALPAYGEKLKINICTRHVNDRLIIDISDSGNGFSTSWLKSYHQDLHPEMSSEISTHYDTISDNHIGIRNSIRRLSLIYDRDFDIDFYNDEGAHIHLELPWKEDVTTINM